MEDEFIFRILFLLNEMFPSTSMEPQEKGIQVRFNEKEGTATQVKMNIKGKSVQLPVQPFGIVTHNIQ